MFVEGGGAPVPWHNGQSKPDRTDYNTLRRSYSAQCKKTKLNYVSTEHMCHLSRSNTSYCLRHIRDMILS